ncbi:MAG: hypothetical protein ACRDRT_10300, partial [Pseudonocardiaceae bacterium]
TTIETLLAQAMGKCAANSSAVRGALGTIPGQATDRASRTSGQPVGPKKLPAQPVPTEVSDEEASA